MIKLDAISVIDVCLNCVDGFGFGQIYLTCPTELALERNRRRVDPVPDEVILKMQSQFEAPNTREAWEQHSIQINSSESTDE